VSGAGTPGEGRNDLVIGETVTMSDTVVGNTGSPYLWTLNDIPIDSATTLTNPTSPTPTFIPDVTGSYKVTCLVAGLYSSFDILAIPLDHTGARIPSFQEELGYDGGGNTKGWHEALTVFMRETDSQLGTGGTDEKVKCDSADTPAGYLEDKAVSGTDITVVKSAGPNKTLTFDLKALTVSPAGTYNYPSQVIIDAKGRTTSATGGSAPTDVSVKVSSNDTTAGDLETKLLPGTNVALTTQNEGGNETLTINVASAAPSGSAGGQLGSTYPNPSVTGITETSGPTALTIGIITDGEYVKRVGSALVSSSSTSADEKVKCDSADTPAGYLEDKLVSGTDITVVKSAGPNKTLTVDVKVLTPDPAGTYSYPSQVIVDTKGRVTSITGGSASVDEKVKVSSNDTTPGDLETKLLPGTNVALTTQNDGGNETRTINVASAAPSGTASGQLNGTYPGPGVIGITETSGPTALTVGVITDGQYLKRVGSALVSAAVSGGGIGGSTDTLISTLPFGEHESWASATPLVISSRQINPLNYALTGTTVSAVFRAAAANGNTGLTTHVQLYNVTDSEIVATLNFTPTALAIQSATLTIGSSAGNLKQADKSYEIRIYVDTPSGTGDTIELGSAELRIINTVT